MNRLKAYHKAWMCDICGERGTEFYKCTITGLKYGECCASPMNSSIRTINGWIRIGGIRHPHPGESV